MVWAALQDLDLGELRDRDSVSLRYSWPLAPFYGLVCQSPQTLHAGQKAPHLDDFADLAALHYLTHWQPASGAVEGAGGTAFYAQRATGAARFGAKECTTLETAGVSSHLCQHSHAFNCTMGLGDQAGCKPEQRAFKQSYQTSSDENFVLLHVVPHAFNRAIIYSAKQLHSAFIDAASLKTLSCDPKVGRLTANLFFD